MFNNVPVNGWPQLKGIGGEGGVSDYEDLSNLPKINSVELKGNKSLSDLGITSENISYDNTDSGLTADDVQAAIDEMVSNFGAGVDSVYNACVSAGSTPASKSPADIAAAIGAISTTGSITKIRTHTGEVSDPNISETISITDDGYLFIVGWNFTNTSNVHINSGSNKISEITAYYFAYNGAPIPVSANDVLHYSNTGTGGCNDGIDIYLVTGVTIPNNTRKRGK